MTPKQISTIEQVKAAAAKAGAVITSERFDEGRGCFLPTQYIYCERPGGTDRMVISVDSNGKVGRARL